MEKIYNNCPCSDKCCDKPELFYPEHTRDSEDFCESCYVLDIASLQERLSDWHDWDGAAYELGACLGFWPEFGATPDHDHWNNVKYVFWSANPLGEALNNFLEALVVDGCLERREEPDIGYRWNPHYKGTAI